MAEISEKQLILPALYVISENGNRIKTSELIKVLTDLMQPEGIDAELLNNRSDTHFSQKVRNLKSHDTLASIGYAANIEGGFELTAKGQKYLEESKSSIDYLFSNPFGYETLKSEMTKLEQAKEEHRKMFYLVEIAEGERERNTVVYKRSAKLRNAAREHFSKDGRLFCDCCNFDFSVYPQKYKADCIEIHHIIPISEYEDSDMVKSMETALKNLMPVCPNCHRVIHKNGIKTVNGMNEFKSAVRRIAG